MAVWCQLHCYNQQTSQKGGHLPSHDTPSLQRFPLPKNGLSVLSTWRFVYSQLFNQDILGGTEKVKCYKRLGYFSFHCPPPPPCTIYDICSLGLWTEGCKAWVVFYLLMRVRVMCAHSAATQTKQKKPFKAPHTMDPSVWVPECKDFVSVLKLLTVAEKHVTRGCIPP